MIGLLGGSFNAAHGGHRRISLFAAEALGLREVWWLVSPGNPLKDGARDMAPLLARAKSARRVARRSIIRPTTIERNLRTRYTVETLEGITRRFPKQRFIWLMGADNLAQFHRWKQWRRIARIMPIAVIARPGYEHQARASRALGALRRFVRPQRLSRHWTEWSPPALVLLRFRPDTSSATAFRRANPDWQYSFTTTPIRDAVTHRLLD
jgi:nicotinate-nucleotide adenylyltransferase